MSDPQQFKIIIEDDEGRRSVVPIELGEVRIGRNEDSNIRLNERNVSRRHARIAKENGAVFAEDLESYNGVFVNGDRVKGKQEIKEGDLIKIGDFNLELRGDGLSRRAEETTQRTLLPVAVEKTETTEPEIRVREEESAPSQLSLSPMKAKVREVKETKEPEPDEVPRHEATAIIRLDTRANEAKGGAQTIAGERAKLVCVSTQYAGNEYEIQKTEMMIGRTDDNDIAVDHRSVSRNHAKITVHNGRYRLTDLDSANGTLVNGEEYKQTELKRGDLVELGHVKFRFVPPGESYTLSAEEALAVRVGAGAPQLPSGEAKALPRGLPVAILLGGGIVLALVVAGILWVLLDRKDPAPIQVTAPSVAMPPAPPTGNTELDGLLGRAQLALSQRRWQEAETLAKAVQTIDPSNAAARDIVERASAEASAQVSFDSANQAIGRSDWAAAWRALRELPEGSVYKDQSKALLTQVRTAYVADLARQAKQAVSQGELERASSLAEEITLADPASSAPASLRAEIEAADAQGRGPAKAKARAERAERPQAKAPPPQKTQPTPPPPTPPPAAATAKDPKALYAEGISALKGGNVDGTIEQFMQCVQADASFGLCYRALGIAYAKSGNVAKAARYYKQYLKVSPNAADAEQVRALLEQYETAP